MSQKNITIVGAGLVGSLLSIFLAQKGHRVRVYERRPDMRSADIPAGRSINLALSDRGWRGLERAGVADAIRNIAIPMRGRMMHDKQGHLAFQPYGKENQAINSVSRRTLNMVLMDCAQQYENVSLHFNERGTDCDLDSATVSFENTATNTQSTVQSDIIIGSDGAFSAIREKMQKTDRYNFSQSYLEHAYKELCIPPGANGEFMMEKNALHIWARHSYMMIALPNTDGTFTCTLFLPYTSNSGPSFEQFNTEEDVLRFFNEEFPDAVPLMPTLLHDFFANPTSSLATMRALPWVWKDKVALIGDAAHAIVPFFGQGMNCGFEDCVVMSECIDRHGENWTTAFAEYEQLRKPNGDAIAQLALDNFIEMRDKVADPNFLLRKKIEAMIHERHPDKFTPLYTLVTFSPDVPYAEAFRRGQENDVLLDKIMALPDIANTWQSEQVQSAIAGMLA